MQSSHSLFSTTEAANQAKQQSGFFCFLFFFFFFWFFFLRFVFYWLSCNFLWRETLVSNDVAITFLPPKSKPVKSCKHLCEKLYKSNFSLKMIRIAILKLITQITFRRFVLPKLWKLGNQIQPNSLVLITLLSFILLITNHLNVLNRFISSFHVIFFFRSFRSSRHTSVQVI